METSMSVPLDLDQLQSFCAIADCGSFTEAARRVNKTQSAVSMQIKRLAVRLLPVILSSFQKTHPKIIIDVRCAASEELLAGMKQGRYDLICFTQGTN